MKKTIIPIFVGLLCTSFITIPAVQTDNSNTHAVAVSSITSNDFSLPVNDAAALVYTTIHLEQYGLSEEAFSYAWKGYQNLLDKKMISRSHLLTICDFSQSSKQKRLYIIDVSNNKLVTNTYVAHGKNSGGEYATQFSNKPESLQSSLGFYVTADTYIGEHGLSLHINGVDPGYNDKALERTIVIHGANYVDAARARAGIFMGRSWGCPAVPQKESANIINTIKNGTCLFIYHPSRNYLLRSKILNG
ncbi:MAG: murein L,D-transpeptidase catalytic domain family protein [Chitinophagaceae bacterium]|nr:murein L,D-transpeptidase catalytic domain family protein [Chitinophagaceae bacterium]MBL0131283.1 murein L,D-transpeptidase catalytic domain family protein [Chitinophagaceae bacterium]MBL0273962.1 murein L,D-transpeptidase catalytic domain family protein [Chitinophagaceae bacterium]